MNNPKNTNANALKKSIDNDFHIENDEYCVEDINQDQQKPYSLSKYMRPPNPLLEKGSYINNEVKAAYRLKFLKLPSFGSGNNLGYEQKICRIDNENNNHIPSNENDVTANSKNLKTLFSLYPENDQRLVYQKYKRDNDIDIEHKIYASLFINVNELSKPGKSQISTMLSKSKYLINNEENIKTDVNTLKFTSNFESGNLFAAFKISNNEYDLILQNDINSKGNTQWFFFSVSNTVKGSLIKFNIVNMVKSDSLFNKGMKPVVLSTLENDKNSSGWQRDGFNISYYKNSILREYQTELKNQKTYYTLTFSYICQYDNDTVYFAQCYPYTYSDLNDYLNKICNDNRFKHFINRKVLCKTLAQNDCQYLTITSSKKIQDLDKRYGIFISARQHPGESLSSLMMQGIIDFLTSRNEEADFLRLHCVFKIIPMLNPDGVIHGNYRTSLSGCDLNRKWNKANKILYPTVYHAKMLIRKFSQERELQLIMDLHGHSRKTNTFIYGCANSINQLNSRIFPYLFAKLSSTFSFANTSFLIHKSKESTARVALWREFNIPNVFTLESSFYGYENEGKYYHYTKQDYINIGRDVCKTLYAYLTQVIMKITNIPQQLNSQSNQDDTNQDNKKPITIISHEVNNWLKEFEDNKDQLIELGEKLNDSGSDSNPSEDDLSHEEISKLLCLKVSPKKSEKSKISTSLSFRKIEISNIDSNITNGTTPNQMKKINKSRTKPIETIISKNKKSKKLICSQSVTEITDSIPTEVAHKDIQPNESFLIGDNVESDDQLPDLVCEMNLENESQPFLNDNKKTLEISELNPIETEIKKTFYSSIEYPGILTLNHRQYGTYSKRKSGLTNKSIRRKFEIPINNFSIQGISKTSKVKKTLLNDIQYDLASIIHEKIKPLKCMTYEDLLIEGRKYVENLKLCTSNAITNQGTCTNLEKKPNLSEQSSTIYKNMKSPKSRALFKQNSPIPTIKESNLLTEISPSSSTSIMPTINKNFFLEKTQPVIIPRSSLYCSLDKKSKINEISSTETMNRTNLRGYNNGNLQSLRAKPQSMAYSKRNIVYTSNNSNNKRGDLQNKMLNINSTGFDLFNTLGFAQKNNNNDISSESKPNTSFNLFNGFDINKFFLLSKTYSQSTNHLISIKDFMKNPQNEPISSSSKNTGNGFFKRNSNIFNLKFKERTNHSSNLMRKNPNTHQKEDFQNRIWTSGLY